MSLAELVKQHEKAVDDAHLKLKMYDTVRMVVKIEGPEFYAELTKSGHDHPEVYRCKCIQDWRNGK